MDLKKYEIAYPYNQIQEKIQNFSNKIKKDFAGKESDTFFVIVLKGASTFFHDFYRKLDLNIQYGFCKVSSYEKTKKKSYVEIKCLFRRDEVENKNIVIIEDIFDTGKTIEQLYYTLKTSFKPRTIELIALIQRKKIMVNRFNKVNVKYIYLLENDRWIFGYGLDLFNELRNLKDIYYYN